MAKPKIAQIDYQRIEHDGFEIVINPQTGECWYPGYRSLARVASIGLEKLIFDTQVKRTVESLLKGATDLGVLEAEIQTPGGIQGATLLPISIGSQVIIKFNQSLAEKMMNAGHTKFLHMLVDFQVELEVTTPYSHILVGNWGEERSDGVPVRKDFNSFLKQIGKPYYDRYTNQCYSALFGCTADTLRRLRTQSGTAKIARNHLPESIELRAVQMLEQAIMDNWESTMSVTRMIVWFGAIIKAQLHLPHFGKSKSRSIVWKEMCGDDRAQISLVSPDNQYQLPEGF